jgi:ankyrin repeat protein
MQLLGVSSSSTSHFAGIHTLSSQAARAGDRRIFENLLNYGASLRLRNTDGMTPLHMAAMHDNTTIVEEVLTKHPALVDEVDADGYVHLAVP